MIAIAVAATKSYLHAFQACIRSISAAAAHHRQAHFIFATDTSDETRDAEEMLRRELPEGWQVSTIRHTGMDDDPKDYKEAAQLRIASLQGSAFHFARSKVRASALWSVESDNIVPANALRVLEWTLAMPREDGSPYYEVAAATYPNGLFLGGFGTPQNPIAEDFLPHERKLKPRLKQCMDACQARLDCKFSPHEMVGGKARKLIKWFEEKGTGQGYALDLEIMPEARAREEKRMHRLRERVKKSPPDGTIWEVIAKHGWRRRGWMDFAYPGIGEGAVVSSDWCGLGCTLMGARALALADFSGYDGKGTQDLFLCWHRWHPAGLKIACVPHVACDHVKRQPDGAIRHLRAYHEQTPEHRGHLRVREQAWVG